MKPIRFTSVIPILASVFLLISCAKETDLLPADGTSANNQTLSSQAVDNSQTKNTTLAPSNGAGTATPYFVDLKILDARVWYGRLEFTVTNQGNGRSAACKALVTFRCNGGTSLVYIDIPSIPGAGNIVTRVHLSALVPTLCVRSDINYTIVVDYYRTVTELNETNNTLSGFWDYQDIS